MSCDAPGPPLVGIFVGGASSRMGMPKGLLRAPDGAGTLVERLSSIARHVAPESDVVLVGSAREYSALELPAIPDAPQGIGPIGGLMALLDCAIRRDFGAAVALACDLAWVDAPLLHKLFGYARGAAAVAPRSAGIWQPLFARYAPREALDAARAVHARQERALWRVLAELKANAVELPLAASEQNQLADWDTFEDVRRGWRK